MNTDGPAGARYEVVAELGRGGAGVVVLARHLGLDRLVAIKRVNGAFALSTDAHTRLQQEAQVLGRLDHPNIVRVYDFARTGEDALIVMEYVDGASLDTLLARGELSEQAALVLLADIGAALGYAHAQGVVHRDVKPSNVLVTNEARAKLADFGVARLVATAPSASSAGEVIGTPAYMAPEQILGDDTDARTDAYAYAAVAYELLTAQAVFPCNDRRALLDAHLHTQPTPPTDLVEGFPLPASDAIMRGLAKRPEDRLSVTDIARAVGSVPSGAWPDVTRPVRPVAAPLVVERTEGNITADDVVVVHNTAPESSPRERVDVPVYAPRAPSRALTRAIVGRMIIIAIIAIALVGVLVSRHEHHTLAVRSIAIDVTPKTGACPRTEYTFTATIVGDGQAGVARLRWLRPDGQPTAVQSMRVPSHRPAHATLRFLIDGTASTPVVASLELLSPTSRVVASPTAQYTCA